MKYDGDGETGDGVVLDLFGGEGVEFSNRVVNLLGGEVTRFFRPGAEEAT